jgi:hypothetical protein
MMSLFMLSDRICPKIRWRIVSIAIVPHYHAACGKSFWMAMRFTLRNKVRRGTGRLWCRYDVASAVDMLFSVNWAGVVKLWSGYILVQKSGQRKNATKWSAPLCQTPQKEGACRGPRCGFVVPSCLFEVHDEGGRPCRSIRSKSGWDSSGGVLWML